MGEKEKLADTQINPKVGHPSEHNSLCHREKHPQSGEEKNELCSMETVPLGCTDLS
jgi:hypothetical protein